MKLFTLYQLKRANRKTFQIFCKILPTILGTILLVSIFTVLVPKSFFQFLFSGNPFRDSLVGGVIGSISAGNPVTSYILGKGLLDNGISPIAVAAFITTWTTVGLLQFPAEALILGKKFALARNLTSFLISLIVAIIAALLAQL